MKARIKFRKYGALRFIGHLDVMRFFQKVMRRAEIPIAFTEGYSPHMIMSFASPLGIGQTSDGEYFDIELKTPIDSKTAIARMNAASVDGIEITGFRQISDEKKASGMTILSACDYLTGLKGEPVPAAWIAKIPDFMAQKEIRVIKETKRSEAEVDIRPMIYDMHEKDGKVFMFLAAGSAQNLKPDLVMQTLIAFAGDDPAQYQLSLHRLEMYAARKEYTDTGSCYDPYISLYDLGQDILL